MYINMYEFLTTAGSTQVDVRYRNTPSALQTITIPALSAAPQGLSLEWLNGVGLVLWGLEEGSYYNLWFDPYFDDWYAIDADYVGISLEGLGLQPGDPFYVRYAPNSSSAQSACVELIVPQMAPAAASAETSNDGSSDVTSIIATLNPETAFTPDGEKFAPEDAEPSTVAPAEGAPTIASTQTATLGTEPAFGELIEYLPENGMEPVISAGEDSI
jgi:hypothetical protein